MERKWVVCQVAASQKQSAPKATEKWSQQQKLAEREKKDSFDEVSKHKFDGRS